MGIRGVSLTALAGLLLLLGAAPPRSARAEEAVTPPGRLYRGDAGDEAAAVGVIRGRAISRGRDAVLFVFDRVTFDPPPGRSEFRYGHDYGSDLEDWLRALEAPGALGPARVFAATTTCARPVEVGSPDWRKPFLFLPGRSPWTGKKLESLEPALRWIRRLAGRLPGRRRAVVLVTGESFPEDLAPQTGNVIRSNREFWRNLLCRFGTYWEEEAIGGFLAGKGIELDVIAPEARFGDFLPHTDVPELPWAARPSVGHLGMLETLAHTLPDLPVRAGRPAGRFRALTPMWFPWVHGFTPFNTDCPSTFGLWPLARSAARTGGCYVFYPYPPARFLDPCPVDAPLRRALAPGTGSARELAAARRGDPALEAVIRAARVVQDETPWTDGLRRASGWLAFASSAPALEKRYRERNKPREGDPGRSRTVRSWKEEGERVLAVVPLHDRATEILVDVAHKIRTGEAGRPHRRSLANLRLARFWFEMSAFHLQALALYLTELEKYVPEDVRLDQTRKIVITYVPTIRLSDCLLGYEGRVLPPEREKTLQRTRELMDRARAAAGRLRGYQGNILPHGRASPWYRSLRHPKEVLKNLDPRLVPRARRMIAAAETVMEHEGRSPWGWMAYYSEAFTFVWKESEPPEVGGRFGRPVEDEDDPETTPRERPRPRSGGGGTPTGR
jgi:hypothetical protein